MLSVHTVLKWPYEDLPVMDSSQAFDVGVLPKINFEFLSLKTVDRKPFEAKNTKDLSTQVGLYKSTFDRFKGHQAELLLVKKLKEQGLCAMS